MRGTTVAAVLGVALVGRAAAQPPAYPASLGARPLVLPDRMLEGHVELFTWYAPDSYDDALGLIGSRVGARGGVAGVEIDLDVGLHLRDRLASDAGLDVQHVTDLAVGVAVPVSRDGAVRATLGFPYPGAADLGRQRATCAYQARRPISPSSDVVVEVGLTFERFDDNPTTTYLLDAVAKAGGRVQVAPVLAVDASVTLDVPVADDEDLYHRGPAARARLRAVVTTGRIDAWLGLASLSSEFSLRELSVGVAGRLR